MKQKHWGTEICCVLFGAKFLLSCIHIYIWSWSINSCLLMALCIQRVNQIKMFVPIESILL